jgi:hypothetical protein
MDPEILRAVNELALTVGGLAAGKPLVEKTLSPAAAYVGESLRGLLERAGNVNVLDVLRRTHRRLGTFADDPGKINPRVFKTVIEDAAVSDDVLTREYYAAILAAARTPDGDDDTTLQLASLLRVLPIRQVRMHYVLYRFLKRYHGPIATGTADDRVKYELYVPEGVLRDASGIQIDRAYEVTVGGLIREGLLDSLTERVRRTYSETSLRVVPSFLGSELFACVTSGVLDEGVTSELRELDEAIRRAFKDVKRAQRDHEREERRHERDERLERLSSLVAQADDALSLLDAGGIDIPSDLFKEMEARDNRSRRERPENERDRLIAVRDELVREKSRLDDWWDDDDDWDGDDEDTGA